MEKIVIDFKTEVLFNENDWEVFQNGENQKNDTKSLFKYFTLNEFSIDSLENNYVYLSNPKDFNDPFDCNRNLIIEKQKEIKDWEYIESLNDISEIGICSFSENGMEPLLWSHYANSYHGFCLKFKPEYLIQKNLELVKLKKVIYSEKPKSISEKLNFAKYYQYILKLENWSYEKECRLLFTNPSVVENKYFYNENAIEEISVGYKFMEPRNEKERELINKFDKLRKDKFKNVPLNIVGPNNTKLELKKLPLKEATKEEAIEMIRRRLKLNSAQHRV
jgi:hypothetical protein